MRIFGNLMDFSKLDNELSKEPKIMHIKHVSKGAIVDRSSIDNNAIGERKCN